MDTGFAIHRTCDLRCGVDPFLLSRSSHEEAEEGAVYEAPDGFAARCHDGRKRSLIFLQAQTIFVSGFQQLSQLRARSSIFTLSRYV